MIAEERWERKSSMPRTPGAKVNLNLKHSRKRGKKSKLIWHGEKNKEIERKFVEFPFCVLARQEIEFHELLMKANCSIIKSFSFEASKRPALQHSFRKPYH